jgi:hypothetical protein
MIPLTALTTLAHLYALQVSPTLFYSGLIVTNTGLSFLWHVTEEQNILLALLDHGVALVWGLTDLSYGYSSGCLFEAFALNFGIVLFEIATQTTNRNSYERWHSVWHLVSACKVFALASLFSSQV